MLQWLKDHFIPHEGNEHQPHFLRLKIAMGLLALIVAIELLYLAHVFVVLPKSGHLAAIFASVLVDHTNEKRETSQLGELSVDPLLVEAARMKAEDMLAKEYFAHYAPDGTEPWYWFTKAGYQYAAAGENLAVNFVDSKDVIEAWMHSPSHRANILNDGYTEIGIATAQGIYKGREAIFVVQLFGRPTITPSVVKKNTPAKPVAVPVKDPPPPKTSAISASLPIAPEPPVNKQNPISVASNSSGDAQPLLKQPVPIAQVLNIQGANTRDISALPTLKSEPTPQIKKLATTPRQATTAIFYALGSILLLALALATFIKIRVQHPHIIANGVLLIFILASFVMFNASLALTQGAI